MYIRRSSAGTEGTSRVKRCIRFPELYHVSNVASLVKRASGAMIYITCQKVHQVSRDTPGVWAWKSIVHTPPQQNTHPNFVASRAVSHSTIQARSCIPGTIKAVISSRLRMGCINEPACICSHLSYTATRYTQPIAYSVMGAVKVVVERRLLPLGAMFASTATDNSRDTVLRSASTV